MEKIEPRESWVWGGVLIRWHVREEGMAEEGNQVGAMGGGRWN